MRVAMSNPSSEEMRLAESTVRSILEAGTPGTQMEAMMRAYGLAKNRSAFAAVLIGNLVNTRRQADGKR